MRGAPVTDLAPPAFPGPPPPAADVVVIGAGIIGIMASYFLAIRGLRTVLVEKGRVGAEQSSRNWGWVRAQGRDEAELPLMVEAHRLWDRLEAETGRATGLVRGGVLYLAADRDRLERYAAWLPTARAHGLDTRLLDAGAVAAFLPGAARRFEGGLLTPSDGRAEPGRAVGALARLAAARGVRIVEGCAARALDLAAGRVAGVITEAGRIGCDAAVLAGGAWSSLFLRAHGVGLPQLSVRATVAATAPLPMVTEAAVSDRHLAFRRQADGGYLVAPSDFHEVLVGPDAFRHLRAFRAQIRAELASSRVLPWSPLGFPDGWLTARRWPADRPSPFERLRILDPRPHGPTLARLAAAFGTLFPALGPVRLAAAWGGMIDTLPDVVPAIDHVAALPGLVLATGMSGHGFGIGPGVGRVVADLVAGDPSGHDLARFRLARFADGSRLVPGPTI